MRKIASLSIMFVFVSAGLSAQISGMGSGTKNDINKEKSSSISELEADTSLIKALENDFPDEGSISFPNAFRWNHGGATGGYWNENESNDFVFRPVFRNVADYKLQIFNRNGELIYESNELYKGWDGYIKNGDVVIQGVYIWKAKGKFTDGTSFDRIGDVTFLY
jgi:hypothetical protein